MIYDYALEDDHDISAMGVPALFKVCPHITREIYYYRDIVTTIAITHEAPWPSEESGEARSFQMLDAMMKFNQMENTNRLLIRSKSVATTINHFTLIKAYFYAIALDVACISRLGRSRKVRTKVDEIVEPEGSETSQGVRVP